MSVISDAIYDKLVNDPKLRGSVDDNGKPIGDGLLSAYGKVYYDPVQGQYVNNKQLAVFTYEPIPTDSAIRSYIITTGHVTDVVNTRFASKTRKAREITRDIRCYYMQDNDPNTPDHTYAEVEAIAERVYEVFHRQPLDIPDPSDPETYSTWQTVMVEANGPIYIPAEQEKLFSKNIDMMVVTLHFIIQTS